MGSLLENIKQTASLIEAEDDIFVPRHMAGRKVELKQMIAQAQNELSQFYASNKSWIDKFSNKWDDDNTKKEVRTAIKTALFDGSSNSDEIVSQTLAKYYGITAGKNQLAKLASNIQILDDNNRNIPKAFREIEYDIQDVVELYDFGKRVSGLGPKVAAFEKRTDKYYLPNKALIDALIANGGKGKASLQAYLRKAIPVSTLSSIQVTSQALTKYFGLPVTKAKIAELSTMAEKIYNQTNDLEIEDHWSRDLYSWKGTGWIGELYDWASRIGKLKSQQISLGNRVDKSLKSLEKFGQDLKQGNFKLDLRKQQQIEDFLYKIEYFISNTRS